MKHHTISFKIVNFWLHGNDFKLICRLFWSPAKLWIARRMINLGDIYRRGRTSLSVLTTRNLVTLVLSGRRQCDKCGEFYAVFKF